MRSPAVSSVCNVITDTVNADSLDNADKGSILTVGWPMELNAIRSLGEGHGSIIYLSTRSFDQYVAAAVVSNSSSWRRLWAAMTRRILVSLIAALTIVGIVACSSEEPSVPPTTPPAEIVMPNLIGKYWMDAEPQLRNLGWSGVLVRGPDVPVDPQDHNKVMTQDPPAGERMNREGPITVRFGS